MQYSIKLLTLLALFMVVFTTSCDDDDPVIEDEEEVITTLTLTLTPVGGGLPLVFNFLDPDGDGGIAPTFTNANLAANTTYNASIELLNATEDPVENITEEIEEEDDEHQFFFTVDAGLDLTINYADQDGDGNPLGLLTTFTTGAASNGNFTVILRHEPAKDAAGVADGDITNAGGETDIEVEFSTTIQ